MSASIQATLYKSPDGRTEEITVSNIREEAAKYINDNSIKVSMEDIGTDFVVYFDDGHLFEDGQTPEEFILFAQGRKCEDLMDIAVEILKSRNAENDKEIK